MKFCPIVMVKAPSVGSYFVKSVVSVYVSVPDELSLHVLPCADRQEPVTGISLQES